MQVIENREKINTHYIIEWEEIAEKLGIKGEIDWIQRVGTPHHEIWKITTTREENA